MIIILDCSKINMEILDASVKTMGPNDYREISEDN